MQNQIKELRVKIDGLSQLTKELKQLHIGDKFIASADNIVYRHKDIGEYWQPKEIEKAYDSLILAKAWLGKVLGELGENTPYVNDGNRKTVEDIEPTADVYTEYNKMLDFNKLAEETYPREINIQFNNKSHIEKVDWLRQEIETVSNVVLELEGGKLNTASWTEYMHEIKMFSYKHLCEARFWLGFELQRIKEERVC